MFLSDALNRLVVNGSGFWAHVTTKDSIYTRCVVEMRGAMASVHYVGCSWMPGQSASRQMLMCDSVDTLDVRTAIRRYQD